MMTHDGRRTFNAHNSSHTAYGLCELKPPKTTQSTKKTMNLHQPNRRLMIDSSTSNGGGSGWSLIVLYRPTVYQKQSYF